MRVYYFWVLFCLLPAAHAVEAFSQQGNLPHAPRKASVISLIPAANWQQLSSEKADVGSVSQWGGDPAVDSEYGAKSAQHFVYGLEDKRADVVVEEAPDTSAAYGLLSYYQTGALTPEKGILLAVSGPGLALMARNRAFVRVLLRSSVSTSELSALLILLGGTQPSAGAIANLPAALPTEGLVPGSEKYFIGPEASRHILPSLDPGLIGFSQGAEAQAARYRLGSARSNGRPRETPGECTIVAITYPTPQIAQQRFAVMEKTLRVGQDRGSQSVYGKHKGSFVILTLNADSSVANRLLAQFRVSQQVSWDQRYPGNKPIVWQMVELVIANFLLAFILAGLAVLGGILIALSRRAAGKWLPHLEWGNPDGETLITLKLR